MQTNWKVFPMCQETLQYREGKYMEKIPFPRISSWFGGFSDCLCSWLKRLHCIKCSCPFHMIIVKILFPSSLYITVKIEFRLIWFTCFTAFQALCQEGYRNAIPSSLMTNIGKNNPDGTKSYDNIWVSKQTQQVLTGMILWSSILKWSSLKIYLW